MWASVATACVTAAVWFWTSSPRLEVAAPATVSAPPPERLPATAAAEPAAARDDIEVTAAIPEKSPVPPQPKTPCANPDALGISRRVEVDTTGGPGFGFHHFKHLDFLTDKAVVLTVDDAPWPGNTPTFLTV